MNSVEVKPSKTTIVLLIVLGIFFLPLGLAAMIMGLLQGNVVPILIGVMSVAMFAFVVGIVLRSHRKSVKVFSEDGLTLNNGRRFSWSDLNRVVDKVRVRPTGGKSIWRTEIQFKNGESAWVIPTKVSNYPEVRGFIESIPCEHTQVRA